MQIETIRAQIEEAKSIERRSGVLYRAIVTLSRQNGASVSALQAGKVIDFVTEYVESALTLMLVVEKAAAENGAQPCVQPLLDAIEDFFLEPDDIIPDHLGLAGLLDDAYLAHTLLQAISDEYASQSGKTLLPKDAYETNTFIRRLIGEPFVSMLDEHVSRTLEVMCGVQEIDQMLVALGRMQLSPVRQPMRGSLHVTELIGVNI
jgi:uncharacterized membrane protein YkvA (DUF1232 family)